MPRLFFDRMGYNAHGMSTPPIADVPRQFGEKIAANAEALDIIRLLGERRDFGKKDDRKVGLLCFGGGARGFLQTGMVRSFYEEGLMETPDVAVGISAGAINLYIAVLVIAQGKEKGQKTYNSFLRDYFDNSIISGTVRMNRLRKLLLYGTKDDPNKYRLTPEMLQKFAPEFYVITTEVDDKKKQGRIHLVNVKNLSTVEEIVEKVLQSAWLPGGIATGTRKREDGKLYVDGGIAGHWPAAYLAKELKLTDELILATNNGHSGSDVIRHSLLHIFTNVAVRRSLRAQVKEQPAHARNGFLTAHDPSRRIGTPLENIGMGILYATHTQLKHFTSVETIITPEVDESYESTTTLIRNTLNQIPL